MFDIEDKLDSELNFFKLNMNAYQKLIKYIDDLDKNNYNMQIAFYDYENEELTSEANNKKTSCLIISTKFKEKLTYKRFLGIPIKITRKNTYDVYAELRADSDVSIKVRSFGKIGSKSLMNIMRKWANENEVKITYNVELVLDYYVVHEIEHKYIWQKNYKN
jgi:hypothetical protein